MLAKKPVKKTNKSSIFTKLKLNTVKGRMIATVLVFALVGGGIMVYKSFAATNSYFSPGVCTGVGEPAFGYCKKIEDNVLGGNKAASPVTELKGVPQLTTVYDTSFNASLPNGYWGRMCIKAKPVTSGVVRLGTDGSMSFVNKSWSLAASTSYSDYCTGWYSNTTGKTTFPKPAVSLDFGNQVLRVNSITVDVSDVNPNATTPAPAK